MSQKISYGDIAKQAKTDPEPFATRVLGGEPTQRLRGQVRYGSKGSLVVYTQGRRQGTFTSFEDDSARGDMLDLYRWHTGSSAHEAAEFAKAFYGISDSDTRDFDLPKGPTPEEMAAKEQAEIDRKVRVAQWIWRSSSETDGREEGLLYLKNRGITRTMPKDTIRFRRLGSDDLEKMGVALADQPATPVVALVFKATNAVGEVVAVQQVITTDARKVSFENPKRTNGHLVGSAVKLPGAGVILNLAEGPETGLSIWQATGQPTWITLGASNFTQVSIPDDVERVIVGADLEKSGTGLAASLKCAQHWTRNGKDGGIAVPRINDGDFNDVLQINGDAHVRASFATAFFAPTRDGAGDVLITPDSRAAFHVWKQTGIETIARVPTLNKETGKYGSLNLDMIVEDRHSRVFLIERPEVEISDGGLAKRRPDLEIVTLASDAEAFRALARSPGAIAAALQAVDMHAPSGAGEHEPVFFTLRKKDTDALESAGMKSIAVRSTSLGRVDLSFMAGRDAIVAPMGRGTRADQELAGKLTEAGARTTTIEWQIFAPKGRAYEILMNDIPRGYAAVDAVSDGWNGGALTDLVEISRLRDRLGLAGLSKPAAQQADPASVSSPRRTSGKEAATR